MAAWAYYRNEAARHTAATETKLNRGDLQVLSDRLCAAKGLDSVRVVVSDRAQAWSWFRPRAKDGKSEIQMAHTMLNVRILAHEWAHYADYMKYKSRVAEFIAGSCMGRPPRFRAHGPDHAKITDWAIEFLMKPMLEKVKAINPIKAAFDALPAELTCPKCNQTKAKAEFGVRVVKKNTDGKPVKIIRQSYCRHCRGQH